MPKDNLPPVHPGEYIAGALEELNLSQVELAKVLGCSKQLVNDILRGRKGLSMDICMKLPVVMGSTPEFWSALQNRHDLKKAAEDKRLQAGVRKAGEALKLILAKHGTAPHPRKHRTT